MSFRSLFSTIKVSPKPLSSTSRSFSSSLSVRALQASVYVSQLDKSITASQLSSHLSDLGLEVVGSRILASEGSVAGAGIIDVLSQDEVTIADVLEGVDKLNRAREMGSSALSNARFKAFLPASTSSASLARPSKEFVEMLNLPTSIPDKDSLQTLIYYSAYSEAKWVSMERVDVDDDGEPVADYVPGNALVKPDHAKFVTKLLSYSGQVHDGNEIIVLPQLDIVEDPYRGWKNQTSDLVIEKEERSFEPEQDPKA